MPKSGSEQEYAREIRLHRSLLIATALQQRLDVKAANLVGAFRGHASFEPLADLMIEQRAWDHVQALRIQPRRVFCHPDVLLAHPLTGLYYRGLAGLSVKAAKEYVGAVERLETDRPGVRLSSEKALRMARTYNLFISSIVVNSTRWTLRNGHRTLLATMGISLDGTMRNRIGKMGEERTRRMVLEWLLAQRAINDPSFSADSLDAPPRRLALRGGIVMEFSSEPDIAFKKDGELLATVEIKGGIDPAGALERYGAAKKSFEHAVGTTSRCRNFYLTGVLTPEVESRIAKDRLVERSYNIVLLLKDPKVRAEFFSELFHHTLRIA
jgi:hypothetical protein